MAKHGSVTATEANRNFSGLLERVKRGETIDITSHGKAVASIRPTVDDALSEQERRQRAWAKLRVRLESEEFKVIGPWTRAELYERN